jgi:hypothetical protein
MENYQLLINGPWINALPTITRITTQVVAVGAIPIVEFKPLKKLTAKTEDGFRLGTFDLRENLLGK